MKKVFVVLSVIILNIILLSACTITKNKEDNMIEFETGIYFDKDWSVTPGTYKKAVVPNEKAALEIAKIIFNEMDKSKDAQEYIPKSVFYDEQDELWIVHYGHEANKTIAGGGCSIAIQKSDGKVLKIWFGE